MPSSSLVELEVELGFRFGLGLRLGLRLGFGLGLWLGLGLGSRCSSVFLLFRSGGWVGWRLGE